MIQKGVLAIWNDVDPAVKDEYLRWHRFEHMPERIAIPGVVRARRYARSTDTSHCYFTMYEAESVETFRSIPYLASLENPTKGTSFFTSRLRNLVRKCCEASASYGEAIAPFMATIRVDAKSVGNVGWGQFETLLGRFATSEGIVAAHLLTVDSGVSLSTTPQQRQAMATDVQDFDRILLVEGVERGLLGTAASEMANEISSGFAHSSPIVGLYDLVLLLLDQKTGGSGLNTTATPPYVLPRDLG